MIYYITILFIILSNKKILLFKDFHNLIVKPHSFSTKPLQSDMGITEIVTEINTLLPQLANFINQFNTTINQ